MRLWKRVDGVAGRSRWRVLAMLVGFALLIGVVGAVIWHLWTGESWSESSQFGAFLATCWAAYAWVVRVSERRRGGR
ncbi:hypothetical protein B046DRAFT_01818 [Streptomyces sp. LamerLS-316]|nr:hypothetical protein B046DRAFT_01818 [Streptomyces sp. LamerLS-316]